MKVDLLKGDTLRNGNPALWIISTAINGSLDVDSAVYKPDENKMWDVCLTCNGVELDFENVVKRINNIFHEAVCSEANDIVQMKFQNVIDTCAEMQERIANMRDQFRYDWEKNACSDD